jgi:hypothetical protein
MSDAQLNALIGYFEAGVPAIFQMIWSSLILIVLVMCALFAVGFSSWLIKKVFQALSFSQRGHGNVV